jgi:uncharacterized protein YutE (UPF0331/DUF86 family)
VTLQRDLLEELERNLVLLEELAAISKTEFLSQPKHYLLAERCFQLSIQCVLDTSLTLCSLKGWHRPEDSRDAILSLGRQQVVPMEFAIRIAPMANFRNILVHAYLGINRELVYRYLSHTGDFREFLRYADEYLTNG